MSDLIIRNCRPMGGEIADILIEGGRIAGIGANLDARGAAEEDAGRRIALPGLVDAHTHLDKSLLGHPWYRNEVGPNLLDKIDNERAVKKRLGLDPYTQAMRQSLLSLSWGTTHIRSHVDVDTDGGISAIEGVMRAKTELAGEVEIEIVAFPQSGLLRRPGTLELMEQAMAMGADMVGGLDPCGIDRDPKGHLDAIFALAEKHGKPIDIHLHEPGELGAFSMEMIFERTRALGMKGNVAVSHAFCLGAADYIRTQALIDTCADLDIAILTTAPASRDVPAVKRLDAAGVKLGAGNDGFRDTWGPYGTGDMLERAMFVGMRNNLRRDDEVERALAICTSGGAQVMGIDGYGLGTGNLGDVVLVEGAALADAVSRHAVRPLVVRGGKVVARAGETVRKAP